MRLSHDNSGVSPDWLVDEVKMRDSHTGEELLFSCRRWITGYEDDREVCREIPVTRPEEHILPGNIL